MLKPFPTLNYNRPRSGFGRNRSQTMPGTLAGTGATRHFLRRFLALSFAASLLLAPALLTAASFSVRRQMEFGVEMALKGSWREAAFRFERVVQDDPKNAFAWNNLGVALEGTSRFEEALAAYEKALELEPKNDRIQENLGRLKAYVATRSHPGFAAADSDQGKAGEKEDDS